MGLFAIVSDAGAQPKGGGPGAPAPSSTSPSSSTAPSSTGATAPKTALGHVVTEIVQGLGQVPPGAVVVSGPIASDVPAPKADELAVKIAAQIAGRLGPAKAHPQAVGLAVARGLSGRAASLVYLQLEIAKGELRVTADLYPVISNGWERLRNPVPGPRAHAFAMAPLDAEVRGFLSPVLLEQARLHKAKHDEGEVLAVGCGDVDADGGLEIVTVSKARVAIGKIREGKLVVQRSTPWSSIASRTPVGMREPLASVLVSPPGRRGEILVGTTERGGVAVDAMLVAKRQLTGLPVPGSSGDACTVPSPEASAFDGYAVSCTTPAPSETGAKASAKLEPPVAFVPPSGRYDAIASYDLVGRDGSTAQILATREPGGKLRLRRQEASTPTAKPIETTIEGVGAQLAILDLDLDGVPEIVTTADGPGDDGLVISSFSPNGHVVAKLRFHAAAGVRAVSTCPPEERGVPAVVAVVGSEVWLVR